jgi:formylglycine-generating enzyme required for sulfatase activity/serine/threonine protein kinase
VTDAATIAGKYRLLGELGVGGMATVYLAMASGPASFRKLVVVKQIRADAAEDPHFVAMFMDEARVAARLSHPNVVGTFEVGAHEGRHFLAMEYVDGASYHAVRSRLWKAPRKGRSEPFALRHSLRVLADALLGLHAAHTLVDYDGRPLHIVHRDVSPQNLLITFDGTAKIADFGIAKAADSVVQTEDGSLKGKVVYMAPEQAQRPSNQIDGRADLYAIGVLLYEAAIGDRRFPGLANHVVLWMLFNNEPAPDPVASTQGLPPSFDAVVARALAPKPEDRYPDALTFREAMEGLLRDLGTPTTAHDVGRVIEAMFDSDRRKRRAVVEAHMAAVRAADEEGQSGPAPLSLGKFQESQAASTKSGIGGGVREPTVPGVRGRIPLVVGLVTSLSVVAAGAFVAVRNGRSSTVGASSAPASAIGGSSAPVAAPTCPAGMIAIAGGSFFQGSNDGQSAEKPAHHVDLSPFCIDRTEVTVADYKACSDRGDCLPAPSDVEWLGISAAEKKGFGAVCNARDPSGRAKHPINCVDHRAAANFCARAKKRLPTEAEWEFAARGPDGRTYPWGNEAPDGTRLNACGKECTGWGKSIGQAMPTMYPDDDGFPATAPVGSFPKGASRFGLEDVVGNVWEWTADLYGPYTDADAKDPTGSTSGAERVIRGGAFNGGFASWVRPTQRYSFEPSAKSHVIGFRCASDMPH